MQNDFRSELEKSIDRVVENDELILSNQKDLIKQGKKSVLSSKFGFSFDDCKKLYAFRSAKRSELDERNYDYFINNKSKFKNTYDIDKFQKEMMDKICGAVNNTDDTLRSYSKCLAVPLFKYHSKDSCLLISQLRTNSVMVMFEISCFNWFDIWFENDEKENRYHTEYFDELIPFKELTAKKQLLSMIYDFLPGEVGWISEFMDVDNIDIEIKDVTIDIGESSRDCYDTYYNHYFSTWFKRCASYRKDKEVLTSCTMYDYSIENEKVIQLIRYVYLMKISSNYTDSIEGLVNCILAGNYGDQIEISFQDKRGCEWILHYLSNQANVNFEKDNYFNLFDYQSKNYFYCWETNSCVKYLEQICENGYSSIFDVNFLRWLLSNS